MTTMTKLRLEIPQTLLRTEKRWTLVVDFMAVRLIEAGFEKCSSASQTLRLPEAARSGGSPDG